MQKNLVYAMVVLLCLAFEFFYWVLLPSEHRQAFSNLAKLNQAWLQISSIGVMLVLAVVLVWGFQVHNQIYDQYFVGWRTRYETTFIIPELCEPFRQKLAANFFDVARQNRETFMKDLFYVYVHDRDPQVVNQNKLARFYEQVTKYWTTQLVEIVFYFMLIATVMCLPIYRRLHVPCTNLVIAAVLLLIMLAVNAWLARKSLAPMELITREQIQEIHTRWSPDLDKRLQNFSQKFGLKYE